MNIENRKGYKKYLIGVKQVAMDLTLRYPKIGMGIGLFLFGLSIYMNFIPGIGALAITPLLIKFDTNGLEGDNLKFVQDLEKRIKQIDHKDLKALLQDDLNLAVREATKMFETIKDLKPEQLTQLKEFLGEDDKGIRAKLLKQGEAISKLQTNIGKAEEFVTIRSQVKDWQTRNKEVFTKIKAGENVGIPALELRAANSPMTPANTLNDTITINPADAIRQGAPVIDLRRIAPTFWDYITKGSTNLESYPWVNKKVPADSGEAAFIGPGIAKPGVSFTFEVEKSTAKKIAVSMKMATELLDDVDGMTSYVQNELEYQLKAKINTTLLGNGAGSSTVPRGVRNFSLGFTTSGLSVPNPNNWDCFRAVVAQMRAAFINGTIVIFANPIDVANMDMDKAVGNGNYTGISTRPLTGAVIVEDNNIPVGNFQAISMEAYKTLIYKAMTMTFGWENDDFTKNLVTVIAETRFHNFFSENDAAGFVYDDYADVKSQIAA